MAGAFEEDYARCMRAQQLLVVGILVNLIFFLADDAFDVGLFGVRFAVSV